LWLVSQCMCQAGLLVTRRHCLILGSRNEGLHIQARTRAPSPRGTVAGPAWGGGAERKRANRGEARRSRCEIPVHQRSWPGDARGERSGPNEVAEKKSSETKPPWLGELFFAQLSGVPSIRSGRASRRRCCPEPA